MDEIAWVLVQCANDCIANFFLDTSVFPRYDEPMRKLNSQEIAQPSWIMTAAIKPTCLEHIRTISLTLSRWTQYVSKVMHCCCFHHPLHSCHLPTLYLQTPTYLAFFPWIRRLQIAFIHCFKHVMQDSQGEYIAVFAIDEAVEGYATANEHKLIVNYLHCCQEHRLLTRGTLLQF